MPCYDGRENERQVDVDYEDRARLRKEWEHNSPVAELLCSVLKRLPVMVRGGLINETPALGVWWEEHQKRDAGRVMAKRRKKLKG